MSLVVNSSLQFEQNGEVPAWQPVIVVGELAEADGAIQDPSSTDAHMPPDKYAHEAHLKLIMSDAVDQFQSTDDDKQRHSAFTILVEATYNEALRIARRLLRNDEQAAEVVQDAYLNAYKG